MSGTPIANFDLHDPELWDDPYPLFRQIREQDPVLHHSSGTWYVTRHADAVKLLKNNDLFSRVSPHGSNPLTDGQWDPTPLDRMMTEWMIFRDPPDHTRLRKLVDKAFTGRMILEMKPQIQEMVDYLLDKVQGAGEMDLIADLAYALPVMVICDMLGVPAEERDPFRHWSRDIAIAVDKITEENLQIGSRATVGMTDYFRDLVERRQKQPAEDLISAMIAADEKGDKFSMDELLANCVFLLWAGHETTKNLIGSAVLSLLRNRDQFERLRAEPDLIKTAVEEFLRYESPVAQVGRWTTRDTAVGATPVPKEQWVVVLLGACNRDAELFVDPDRLDVGRRPNRHIAFGSGIHTCLGNPLARAEGQVAIDTLLRRMPNLSGDTGRPNWQPNANLRGLASFHLTF